MATYIDDINHFYKWLEKNPLPAGAVAVYGYLLHRRNLERQKLYVSGDIVANPPLVYVKNGDIRKTLCIKKVETLNSYVKTLSYNGLIFYRKGDGKEPSTYYFNHYV